jgi:acetaldehyde dehydrogenase (acetylating)
MEKTKVGIIGTGKVGTDLLLKVLKSKWLDCVIFAGVRHDSPGIALAKSLNVNTSVDSIDAILKSEARIVFDATTAKFHESIWPLPKQFFVIDLTPSKLGLMCVPSINMKEAMEKHEVSLISCGAQAVIPKIAKLKNKNKLEYIEVVTTVATESAGVGTRDNMSEYLKTTSAAITQFFEVPAKSIFIINPAVPPINMFNTVYAKFKGIEKPTVIQFTVKSKSDYLKKWEGNLDVINRAAINVAEKYAKNISC